MPTDAAFAIDAEQAAFLQQGVSITAGACNSLNVPSATRAFGCKVSPDRQRITIYLSKVQAAPVLRDVASNGAIAVVFSAPSTHRTIQIKGTDAVIGDIDEAAVQLVEKHREEFSRDILSIGFSQQFIQSLLACPSSELVSISFSPCAAFSQTPGPKAGERLRPGT